jgi:ubiquinone/menaquinone biosynthesis C-methylase UbiE
MSIKKDVCGVEHVQLLDNGVRRLLQYPKRMFGDYIKPGDTVVDIGCGPGVFIPELAKMIGSEGKVVAIDLQNEMLQLAEKKIMSCGLADRVQFHQCKCDALDIELNADFILTFYMVHESPDPLHLIDQICFLLKQGGYYYLSEPKFHVSKEQYLQVVARCKANGLSLIKESGLLSRTAVFQKRVN